MFIFLCLFLFIYLRLCLAGCSVSGPTIQVFGQPAAANLTVTSSCMAVAAGQQYTAGSAGPHPPSLPHTVQIPQTDARWAISITAHNDEPTNP